MSHPHQHPHTRERGRQMNYIRPWKLFNPRNSHHVEFITLDNKPLAPLALFDMWFCELEEKYFAQIALIIFTNGNVGMDKREIYTPECSDPPKVIVQITETCSGEWSDYSIQKIQEMITYDYSSEYKEILECALTKLKELNLIPPFNLKTKY